jgi:lipopolysaccharide cholinephosphotransferase
MEQTPFDKQFKAQILHVFKYTVKFLEKHGLHYVACGGTVLGAVRHRDFIPWDDDIDIYMPRADYERLLDLKAEVRRDGFDVLSLRDKGYYLPFAKVSDMHTTLWEQKEFPFVMGVYVDVFALDNFDCSDEELTAIQRKSLKKFYNYQKTVEYTPIYTLLHPLRRLMLKRFMDYQTWYSSFDGPKTVCVTQWAGKIFKREWFEDTIDQPFGDTTVIIPRDYDGYLKCLYGDYMTLPPEEKRVSEHNHYYLDFGQGLTLAEIKKKFTHKG